MELQNELQNLETAYQESEDQLIEDWKSLLRFKSISTNPGNNTDCINCAEWLLDKITSMKFKGELIETVGKPIVFGEYIVSPTAPTALFYGHYDVQPPEPLNEWKSGAFEPELRDGKMYARGASDNKGQVTFVLGALNTLIKNNSLKVNVKVLIEGEEESGSKGLSSIADKLKEKFKADLIFVSDTSMVPSGAPSITMGLRGLAALSVTLKAYPNDLHSGLYGGALKNPITELARIVSTLHESCGEDAGKVAIKGFYDDLIPHSVEEQKLSQTGKTSDQEFKDSLGAEPTGGEQKFSTAERIGFRPTVEVNGFTGGYGGPGGKTIIPAEATTKLSMRLGTGQDPARILKLVKNHLLSHAPKGMKMEFDSESAGGGAIRVNLNSPWLRAAEKAHSILSKEEIAYRWEGGSIPVIEKIIKVSGAEPVFVGFGKAEDNWHAPNESLALDRFKRGFLFSGLFFAGLVAN